jgi:hypothetical protein
VLTVGGGRSVPWVVAGEGAEERSGGGWSVVTVELFLVRPHLWAIGGAVVEGRSG